MSEDEKEQIGLLIDKCENCIAFTVLPLPPGVHVDGLLHGIKEVRDGLKAMIGVPLDDTYHEDEEL